jgi:tetratricopeptide (TPR) repeat protein
MARTFIVFFVLMLLDAPGLVCAESPGASPLPSTSITRDYTQDYILTFKSEEAHENTAAFLFLQPNEALTAKTTRQTPRLRAAALRLAEEGRKLLEAGDYQKALARLEKGVAIDSNPYIYYYLARAHYYLRHYRESLKFLEVAQSWFWDGLAWTAEIVALRDENIRALANLSLSHERN